VAGLNDNDTQHPSLLICWVYAIASTQPTTLGINMNRRFLQILFLVVSLTGCALQPARHIWVGIKAVEPPPELQPELDLLLEDLTYATNKKFNNFKDYPYPKCRVVITFSFNRERSSFEVLNVENAPSKQVFETVQIAFSEAVARLDPSPQFVKWLSNLHQITFDF